MQISLWNKKYLDMEMLYLICEVWVTDEGEGERDCWRRMEMQVEV